MKKLSAVVALGLIYLGVAWVMQYALAGFGIRISLLVSLATVFVARYLFGR